MNKEGKMSQSWAKLGQDTEVEWSVLQETKVFSNTFVLTISFFFVPTITLRFPPSSLVPWRRFLIFTLKCSTDIFISFISSLLPSTWAFIRSTGGSLTSKQVIIEPQFIREPHGPLCGAGGCVWPGQTSSATRLTAGSCRRHVTTKLEGFFWRRAWHCKKYNHKLEDRKS